MTQDDQEDSGRDINSFSSESKRKKISDLSVSGYQCEPEKEPRDPRKIKGENAIFFRRIWLAMVTAITCLICQYLVVGCNDMLGIGRDDEKVNIEIPKGANNSDVAKILREKDVIREVDFFLFYNLITKSLKNVISGNFEISKNLDYEAIVNFLQSNSNRSQADVIELTFREGLNAQECSEILEKNGVCDAKDFFEICNSDFFKEEYGFFPSDQNKGKRPCNLEGRFFPDTYKFYKNSNPRDAARKFLNNFENKIAAGRNIKKDSPQISIEKAIKESNMSLDEVITLASIIQAEASSKQDMGVISSVFHNRLKTIGNGGKSIFGDWGVDRLESDPTVWYPYRNRESVPNPDTFNRTHDTYSMKGLPPGPICNPGIDAILAAIFPDNTDYYFFCHASNGKIFLAKDKVTHQKNVKNAGIRQG
ncbi:MAG: endolytic transglycosylase MltG [Oscillospiraceae bacterium]|jgi:UPF0755 protein|nr:endolytic transglycosylase MltG [Oscillospiraceae bacterium]